MLALIQFISHLKTPHMALLWLYSPHIMQKMSNVIVIAEEKRKTFSLFTLHSSETIKIAFYLWGSRSTRSQSSSLVFGLHSAVLLSQTPGKPNDTLWKGISFIFSYYFGGEKIVFWVPSKQPANHVAFVSFNLRLNQKIPQSETYLRLKWSNKVSSPMWLKVKLILNCVQDNIIPNPKQLREPQNSLLNQK